jgi:6,7-dimethyl-8-ribityllumazine synthase
VSGEDQARLQPAVFDRVAERVGRQLGAHRLEDADGRGLRVGLACSMFNGGVTARLLEGALDGLEVAAVDRRDVTVVWVPGAFELPLAAQRLAAGGQDAVVCLGAVIRGETAHFDLVANGCATGLSRVALDAGVPVVLGVLATEDLDQALERSRPDTTNKGWEAALSAVHLASVLRAVPSSAARRAGAG